MSGTTSGALITSASPRTIGTIIPDILIEEVNHDELEITQHPVERGSPITDHSYLRPVEVSLRVGWSNSGHSDSYVLDVYDALRSLQATRQPFDVFTGTRIYNNMLLASLVRTVNAQSGEFTLMVQALLREIIIVSTQATQAPAPAPETAPKTSGTSGQTSKQPKAIKASTNTALNTQCKQFAQIDQLPVGGSSTASVTPLLSDISPAGGLT